MLRITYNQSDKRVVAALRAKGPELIRALVVKMNGLMLELQSKIVGEKLQGQVLKHRSGKLAGSIRVIPVSGQGGPVITGAVEGGGGPAFYGRMHEFGGVFDVKSRMITEVFGKKVKVPHPSRPYTVTFPERSFMGSSLNEMNRQIFAAFTQTLKEQLEK